MVAFDQRSVSEHDPPAIGTPLLGNSRQQDRCFRVIERNERQFTPAIESGDDPRRPSAESSAAREEKNRT
jgi:hypothetical protein